MLDLRAIAVRVVEEMGAAPCAVVAAARRRPEGWSFGSGAAGLLFREGLGPVSAAEVGTVFDLASVTKPATALTLARLERAGALSRSESLGAVIPELADTASGSVPLDLLAAHRAGLDGHRPLYAPLERGEAVDVATALRTAAEARRVDAADTPDPEDFAPVYSDLGYLLLGAAMARRTGLALDALMEREISAPLGLRIGSAAAWRRRDPTFDERVAPTERVEWRGGVVRGAVHDENAWALAGSGAAGHAGLFGDALAGRRPDWLGPADLEPVLRRRPGGSYVAGFDRRSGDAPSSGALFGPSSFGHLGFTGTSLWIDPDAELVGVLLTNRVHPTRAWVEGIRRARPATYDAIVAAMTEEKR